MGSAIRGGWLVKAMWLAGLGAMLLGCGDDGAMGAGDGSDAGAETTNVDAAADETGGDGDGDMVVDVDGGADAAVEETITPLAMADGSDGCEPGQLLDDSEQCVEACSLFDCGAHGACQFDAETAAVACVCEDGNYAGDHCESCSAAAFDDGNGNCTDPCADVDCGPGVCGFDGDGTTHCSCAKGSHLAGDACDECEPGYAFTMSPLGQEPVCELALPPTTNMKVWLDADNDSSVGLVEHANIVESWTSILAANPISFLPPAPEQRPFYNDAMVGTAQAAVVFAPNNALGATLSLAGSYSVFVVLQASDNLGQDTILGGVDAQDSLAFWLRTNGSNLEFSHKVGGVTEKVVISNVTPAARGLVEVHRRGLEVGIYTDGKEATSVISANALPILDYELGRNPATTGYRFEGSMYEVIIVSPAVAPTDRAAFRDYLNAKWKL